jgi:hypothetical protein
MNVHDPPRHCAHHPADDFLQKKKMQFLKPQNVCCGFQMFFILQTLKATTYHMIKTLFKK